MRSVQLAAAFLSLVGAAVPAGEFEDDVRAIARAGPEGSGSPAARQAAERLSRESPGVLPRLLEAMDTGNPVAANWYRVAFERIVEREWQQASPKFPSAELEAFVVEGSHGGRPRRLAFQLLARVDATIPGRLLPGWLDDEEFRGDAVTRLVQQADAEREAGRSEVAIDLYRKAFRHSRDSDQVLQAVARLKSVGVDVDPVEHLGILTRWYLWGPYAAAGMTGYRLSLPPEQAIHPAPTFLEREVLTREYEGTAGRKLRWQIHTARDPLGQVNLIQALGPVEEAVAYAYAEIESPRTQQAQLRCSADDNLAVWLNGRQVLAREQWLNGTRFDRFIQPIELAAGRNHLLVKICQGPHHVDPAVPNNWSFQVRICDASGGAVGVRTIAPALQPSPP